MTGARDITQLCCSPNLEGMVANKIEQSFYSVYSYSRIKSIELALSHLPTPPPLFIILSNSYSLPHTTPLPRPPYLCSLIYLQILLFICLYSIHKTDHQTFDEGMGWVGKRGSVLSVLRGFVCYFLAAESQLFNFFTYFYVYPCRMHTQSIKHACN